MAEDNTLFGTMLPVESVESVRARRLGELQTVAQDQLNNRAHAIRQTPLDPMRYRMDDFLQRKQAEANINAELAAPSPEEQMAALGDRVRQRIAKTPGIRTIPMEQQQEMGLRIAYEEAQNMGLGDVAVQLGQKYAQSIQTRVKKQVELEKLAANTMEAQNNATKSGYKDVTRVDPDSGDSYTDTVDINTGETTESRLTNLAQWTPIKTPDGRSGLQKGGKIITAPVGSTPKELEKAANEQNAVESQLMHIDNQLNQLGIADDLTAWNTTGKIGAALAEQGAVPYINVNAPKLKATLTSLRSALAFDQLQQMKNSSATGASGLGSISKIEIELLQSYLQSLDQKDYDAEGMKAAIQNIQRHYVTLRGILKGDIGVEQIDWSQPFYQKLLVEHNGKKYFKADNGDTYEITP